MKMTVLRLIAFVLLVLPADSESTGQTIQTQRVNVQVDGGQPLAGERSCLAVAPSGDIAFTWTLAAGDLTCKPLGHISTSGHLSYSAIDSETTWNVEGWGSFGSPFDLQFDRHGHLHIAARFHGKPYGVDYWHQVDGQWQLETFGQNVTFGGNNVSLAILPDSRPIVVCMTRDRTRLAVWERSANGRWTVSRPVELQNVAAGHFDLVVSANGDPQLLFCPTSGGLKCATRNQDSWAVVDVVSTGICRHVAAATNANGQLHVSFAAGQTAAEIRAVMHAILDEDGSWNSAAVARTNPDQHVNRTDIATASGRTAIVWERGAGAVAVSKDYGSSVGSVELTLLEPSAPPATHTLASPGGRPSLALTPDGETAWVGVYSGNDNGDDFFLLNCSLTEARPTAIQTPVLNPEKVHAIGCLRDIQSGNQLAMRRGIKRLDMQQLSQQQRLELINRFVDDPDPVIRTAIIRELARDPVALQQFNQNGTLAAILRDPDRLVRKTLLTHLVDEPSVEQIGLKLVTTGLADTDAMNRLASAEVMRRHADWPETMPFRHAIDLLVEDLGHTDVVRSGAAGMALERLVIRPDVIDAVRKALTADNPNQRVLAALILWRTSQSFELSFLTPTMEHGTEATQLALCGLLGQMRQQDGIPLLEQALQAPSSSVRAAAVYALRSAAHVADLSPVARHPKGFDILALRSTTPRNEAEQQLQQAAIHALENALRHTDANVREKAADALGRVNAAQSLSKLASLITDPDSRVRTAAQSAISVLRGTTAEALINNDQWRNAAKSRPARIMNPVFRAPTELRDGVIQAGSDTQLFIDDFVIEQMSGLQRRLHPFRKHPRNPIFQAQLPWEEGWADPFMSTVIYDPDDRCFRMWYRCGPRHSLKAYAVSEDGIDWHRPDIAVSTWDEFDHHNLLGFEGQIAIWKKPGNNVQFHPNASDPANRYLSLFFQHGKTYGLSRSTDGVRWSQPETVRPAYGDVVSLISDPSQNNYLFFPKYMREQDGFVRRSFAAVTLEQLNDPFQATFPFLAGHREDGLVADGACRAFGSLLPDVTQLSQFHSEIYSVTAIPYEGITIALYDLWPVIGNREGPLDMPMKISRDMKTWNDVEFPARSLSIGRFGEWDSGMVYGANTMLVVDDEIRLYYLGASMGHCTNVLPMTRPWHSLGVGLATLRLDGFASLQADADRTGTVTTRPLRLEGDRLFVNADCRPDGWIKAELLDSNGQPVPGFTLDDCEPVRGDSLRHILRWNGNASLHPGISSSVCIRFAVHDADLYSFRAGVEIAD